MRITKATPIPERNKHIDLLIKDRPVKRLSDYQTRKIKVLWQCSSCSHEWWSLPDVVVYQGSNCPECWETRRGVTLRSVTKQQARVVGKNTYFTGKPCKHGHIVERFVTNSACVECEAERHRVWVKENPEKQRRINIRHKSARRMNSLRHSATKRKATPGWADRDKLRTIHTESVRLSEETGVVHHVHHRIPLRDDKGVCGLNVPDNLFILTEQEHQWFHAKKERLLLLY